MYTFIQKLLLLALLFCNIYLSYLDKLKNLVYNSKNRKYIKMTFMKNKFW